MTLSVWRLAHLALAICSFLFLASASITGAILGISTAYEKVPSYRTDDFNAIRLSETLPALRKVFPEITELTVDNNEFVILQGTDRDGNDVHAYIDARTGKILGTPQKKSQFIQWVTSFHRSLFMHEAGRLIVGINAFLLLLIAITGSILIVQRQRGLRRFFSKIIKDNFVQYYHVILGRLLLIPILVIAVSGTYLSMDRFHLFPEQKIVHKFSNAIVENPVKKSSADFPAFKNILLSDVQKIEFPFIDDDPEEHYTLKLDNREVIVDQFSGEILSEVPYSATAVFANLSLDLHTGQASAVWAIILAIASLNILFFIYSGFAMTLKRREIRIKNKFRVSESDYILLAGSENGSTLLFANAIHKQLIAHKKKSHLTELNNYSVFPDAQHIIIFTSTHGLGDAPSNANKAISLIEKYPQTHPITISVVGFGSHSYPDFCGFARKLDEKLVGQPWAERNLEFHTVNDKSPQQFTDWVNAWNAKTGLPLSTTPAVYSHKPGNLQKMKVVNKIAVSDSDETFILTLTAGMQTKFASGDLLAVYPDNDSRERLYSIGKYKGNIQLAIKLHPSGFGSGYLNKLEPGDVIKAGIIRNASFHFPKKAPVIALIANGTGIAPFLGMLQENNRKTETHLYCGFRKETKIIRHYKTLTAEMVKAKRLTKFHMAFSREDNRSYVMDLIARDAHFFANLLSSGGTIMICGSVAMQRDVEAILTTICLEFSNNDFAGYKNNGQILTDCY